MSATSGSGLFSAIFPKASAASSVGTVSRAISQPAVQRALSWERLASTSVVFVLHMDWMETGAPPPTATFPTLICLVISRTSPFYRLNITHRSFTISRAISPKSRAMAPAWI